VRGHSVVHRPNLKKHAQCGFSHPRVVGLRVRTRRDDQCPVAAAQKRGIEAIVVLIHERGIPDRD